MSLPFSAFEAALKALFNDMSGDDRNFADGFAGAVKDYAESGTIATVDAGAVSAGAFAGTGQGSITVRASDCADIVYAGEQAMAEKGGNDILAGKMAEGVNVMITSGQVKTNVTGVCTPPPPAVPFTLAGTAEGTMTGVPAPMEAAFFSAFETMNSMSVGNNDYMASQCAAAITAYLVAAVVNTQGQGALTGSAGTGVMS
jgi:hypothetical protein